MGVILQAKEEAKQAGQEGGGKGGGREGRGRDTPGTRWPHKLSGDKLRWGRRGTTFCYWREMIIISCTQIVC